MAISYVGAGARVAQATNWFDVPLPSGLADRDALVLFFYGRSGAVVTGPRNWSQIYGGAASNRRLYAWFRQYNAQNMAGRTFQVFNGVNNGQARILAFRTDTAGSIVAPTGALSSIYTGTGVTNVGAIGAASPQPAIGAIIFHCGQNTTWTSVATLSGNSLTWTELFDDASALGNGSSMAADFASWTSAPTLTAKTFTVTGGSAADALGYSFILGEYPADTVLRRDRTGTLAVPATRRLSRPVSMPLVTMA